MYHLMDFVPTLAEQLEGDEHQRLVRFRDSHLDNFSMDTFENWRVAYQSGSEKIHSGEYST